MLKSVETMIGSAIFIASFIAIVVVGSVQLPLNKPECAKEPTYAINALADELVEKISIVWCEQGAVASVLLSSMSFCYFLLAFTMLLSKVMKYQKQKRMRLHKQKLREQEKMAQETGGAVHDETRDYGEGFQLAKMAAKDPVPGAIFQDMDARIFEL